MRRWLLVMTIVLMSVVVGPISSAAAGWPGSSPRRSVVVNGEVSSPASYTAAQLARLPQTTLTLHIGHRPVRMTGVLLETLVNAAQPAYPDDLANTKNEPLRVTVTVQGASRQSVTFALGELSATFGNHPALLALTQNGRPIPFGPMLVVPGDSPALRTVPQVRQVTVGITTGPATDTEPTSGSPVEVIMGGGHVTLSADLLARLPSETHTVSFASGSNPQTHTEVGPSLLTVLAALGIRPTLNTWVAAVGYDNYTATVTPGEQLVGGRSLQLSLMEDGVALPQPRLVVDGDIKGGRYVSGVVTIYAGTGPAH